MVSALKELIRLTFILECGRHLSRGTRKIWIFTVLIIFMKDIQKLGKHDFYIIFCMIFTIRFKFILGMQYLQNTGVA